MLCYVMGGTGFIKRGKLGERQATLNHRWNTAGLIGKSRAVPNDSPPPKRGAAGPSSPTASVHLDLCAADCSDGRRCVRVGRVGGEPAAARTWRDRNRRCVGRRTLGGGRLACDTRRHTLNSGERLVCVRVRAVECAPLFRVERAATTIVDRRPSVMRHTRAVECAPLFRVERVGTALSPSG